MFVSLFVLACGLILGACVLLNHPRFGKAPKGARLEAIERSPNYVDGAFRNLIDTPKFTQDASTRRQYGFDSNRSPAKPF